MNQNDKQTLKALVEKYDFEALAHTLSEMAQDKVETSTLDETARAFHYHVVSNRFWKIAHEAPRQGVDY